MTRISFSSSFQAALFAVLISLAIPYTGARADSNSGSENPSSSSDAADIRLILDNAEVVIDYAPGTVGELFAREGLRIPTSLFGLSDDSELQPGLAVRLKGVRVITAQTEIVIPAPVLFKYEFDPENRRVEVADPGRPGREKVTVRRYLVGDKIIGEAKKRETMVEPVRRLVKIYIGVTSYYSPTFEELLKNPLLSRELPPPGRYTRKIEMEATAYYPGFICNGKWGYITAMGYDAGPGRVAVDPKVIKLGSRLFVKGYGYCVAVDTGGAIKGNRIDLCYETREECIQFGRRQVVVYVLD